LTTAFQYWATLCLPRAPSTMGLNRLASSSVVVRLKNRVAASCWPLSRMLVASRMVNLESEDTKTGAASFTALSAARLRLWMRLSQSEPKPIPRSALSTFCASGGMSIFTAALPRNPSVTANDLMLRSKPWLNACLMPDAASLELTDEELLLDVVEVGAPLVVDN